MNEVAVDWPSRVFVILKLWTRRSEMQIAGLVSKINFYMPISFFMDAVVYQGQENDAGSFFKPALVCYVWTEKKSKVRAR